MATPAAPPPPHLPTGRICTAQGTRSSQEDRALVWEGTLPGPSHSRISIYAVCDGHNGHISADTITTSLIPTLLSHSTFQTTHPNIPSALHALLPQLETLALAATRAASTFDGATLCVAVLHDGNIHVANVGDCRAVLASRGRDGSVVTRQLTMDHKVGSASEKRRLVAAGAVLKRERLLGIRKALSVSRALGDRDFKDVGIGEGLPMCRTLIADPEVVSVGVEAGDVALLVGTDGLWDIAFLGNEEIGRLAVGALGECKDVGVAAERVVGEALRFRDNDNVSLVLVRLNMEGGTGGEEGVEMAEVSKGGKPKDVQGIKCTYWEVTRAGVGRNKGLLRSVSMLLSVKTVGRGSNK